MRQWAIAPRPLICGSSRHGGTPKMIPTGSPVQILRLPDATFERYRCTDCAVGTPPPNLGEDLRDGH